MLTKGPVTWWVPECFGFMHFPALLQSSLTLLSLHPLALQQADVESLLCVFVPDVLPGSQHLKRVPWGLDVTRWAHRPLVLNHLRGQPKERSEVKDQQRKSEVSQWWFSRGLLLQSWPLAVSLLWCLGAEDGIKVVVYLHLVGSDGELLDLAVELGKGFVFERHHFLDLLLCDCYGRLWQSRHWEDRRLELCQNYTISTIHSVY